MSHYKPYAAYKDSGVKWLGAVPEHWDVKRLRFVADPKNSNVDKKTYEGQLEVRLCNYTDVYYNDTITPELNFMQSTASELEIGALSLLAGDVIITKDSETADDIGIPAYVPEVLPGVVCGYHLTMLRSHGVEGEFLFRILQAQFTKAYFFVEVSGVTRFGLGQDAINNIVVPLPGRDEQRHLCRWINRETLRIDGLVSKKTCFIELLREKRQSLITHAVTKGLDPNVQMKDSGVEWLGDVPEHWEVRKTSSVSTKITNGYVGPTRDILVEDGVRYLQSLHIKGNEIKFKVPYFVTEAWSKLHQKSILKTGDVLIVQTGEIGQVAVVTDEFSGCNCHALIIVSPHRATVSGKWLSWVLNSSYGRHSLLSIQTGEVLPHLNCGNVKDVYLPVPPLIAQQKIIHFIECETTRIDTLIRKTERSIELLKERRGALITAAVTGQIDIRENKDRQDQLAA